MISRAGSGSFLKERTRKRLAVRAEPSREDRSQNDQKLLASFFQERTPFLPPASGAA
jgi:hypothetical protein